MSGSSSAERKRHEPLVLVETADLSEEDWLDYRRRGIGGSDVSAIFGTSPFRTARDLYYDKLNIASVEDDEGNWVAMEMGHLLEPLVAKIFERKTGYRVYQIKKMFQHPQYPWMLADVDYFVELPDGTTAILEIKTTNYNARDNWWMNGKETVPVYYESQGRHYMAVTDIDRCFFCCLYGNNEEEVIIREVKRDFEYEAEMVFLEQYFWENHVQRHVPPPYTESGALIIESARKHFGPADKNAPAVALDLDMTAKLMQYLRLLDEKKNAEVYSKEIDKDIQRLKALLIAEMGTSCTAVCEQEGVNYTVTYTPVRKSIIDKDTYIIFITANDKESDMLKGYEVGGADYVTKPFSVTVLCKKVAAFFANLELRTPRHDLFDDGFLKIDFSEQSASLAGESLDFTPKEYRTLFLFVKNPRIILTKRQILEKLWDIDGDFVDEHTLTTIISRIRKKIETDERKYIKTAYGMGYQWIGGEPR